LEDLRIEGMILKAVLKKSGSEALNSIRMRISVAVLRVLSIFCGFHKSRRLFE
jgi:hypothetical protein